MDAAFRRQLMTYLDTGHRHNIMSEMMNCDYCGKRFKAGEKFYNRMRKEHPELFIRKTPKFEPSEELKEMNEQLVDRVKNDKMYRDHLLKSQYGTIEEQNKEADLANKGFYKKNSGYEKKFI